MTLGEGITLLLLTKSLSFSINKDKRELERLRKYLFSKDKILFSFIN